MTGRATALPYGVGVRPARVQLTMFGGDLVRRPWESSAGWCHLQRRRVDASGVVVSWRAFARVCPCAWPWRSSGSVVARHCRDVSRDAHIVNEAGDQSKTFDHGRFLNR